ncbi:hypothetical protein M0802_006228 [Mischocyttarus mexicanus]|nr:hypothetical protein M0802_006228 [Mischocyttarus mexicanus]
MFNDRGHRNLIIDLQRLSSKKVEEEEGVLPVMSISRARSWPLLDTEGTRNCRDDEENCKGNKHLGEEEEEEEKKKKFNGKKDGGINEGSPQVQARRLMCRHYYPEGGWGWVVTVVGTLVHLLGPGLQLSVPATLALPATVKFYHHPLHTAGISYLNLTYFCSNLS